MAQPPYVAIKQGADPKNLGEGDVIYMNAEEVAQFGVAPSEATNTEGAYDIIELEHIRQYLQARSSSSGTNEPENIQVEPDAFYYVVEPGDSPPPTPGRFEVVETTTAGPTNEGTLEQDESAGTSRKSKNKKKKIKEAQARTAHH